MPNNNGDRIGLHQTTPRRHHFGMETHTFCRRSFRDRERRPSAVTVPIGVSPIVKLVFSEIQRQNIRYQDVEDRSGVQRTTLKAWRHKNTPSLANLVAVLEVLGWDFVPVPRDRVLSADVLAVLAPAAEKVGLDLGDAAQFAAEIAFGHPSAPTIHAPAGGLLQ